MGDAGKAVDHGKKGGEDDAGEQSSEGRARDHTDGRSGEGGAQHLAFEADVDHAGALGEQSGKRGQNERDGEPDGGIGQQNGLQEEIHQETASALPVLAKSASSDGRNICSSAPANRITSPWITTTMSRLIVGMSKESSEPP